MKIHLSGEMVFLWGNWTQNEVNYCNIDALTGLLDLLESEGRNHVRIDCAHLESIDFSGARFLDIWLNCLDLRGIEHEIINIGAREEAYLMDLARHNHLAYQNPFMRKSLTSALIN